MSGVALDRRVLYQRVLYQRVLGARFDVLPEAVQRLHDVTMPCVWTGQCQVARGAGLVARLAGWIGGLPPATEGMREGFRFEVRPEGDGEIWTRGFGGMAPFKTRQWAAGALLCERAGPMTMVFALLANGAGLRLELERCFVLGVPLPRVLHPRLEAVETEVDGAFQFDVSARFPTGGLLVRYRGKLMPDGADRTI